jgi:predicted kinase
MFLYICSMKTTIKEILRESVDKNSLGVAITRPNQTLIIMRGIPGAGKSTKAKELAGSTGVIHSTDDVIESQGDYNSFFQKMFESKDFKPLSRAHSTNLKNLITSLKEGISPVILDNTNIKQNEPKAAVKAALEMGLSDKNIKIVDVGTNGLTAEQLAARNTHGVPLDKIKSMIESHKGQGVLTVESILSSKDMYKESDVLYSAVVLDNGSRNSLLSRVEDVIPQDWKVIAHHMTIVFGKPVPNQQDLGKQVNLRVTEIGLSDMAMAVRVDGYPSTKEIPHITIAINPDGGKPVMSNQITNWGQIKPFSIMGVVTEIKKGS